MGKLDDIFSGKICSRIDNLYYGVDDASRANESLRVLDDIQGILQEFRMETNGLELDKSFNIQLATQFKNAAAQFIHLEEFYTAIRDGKEVPFDSELAKKYVSNLHLIFNSFKDYAIEIDRGYKKMD